MTQNTVKFVASMTFINEDVDMDVEFVRSMLSSPKGTQELYDDAACTPGEIYIVDADLGVAELIAARLNDAYAEYLEVESTRAHAAAASAREAINAAFEGDSRVGVAASAEEEALANIEAKKSTKQQTKNEKVETTMTKLTQEQINAQTTAAQAFLAQQSAKMQNAVKGSASKKEEKKTESNKPSVKVPSTKKEEEVVNVRKGSINPSVKVNVNTKEETTMENNRQSAGVTGRQGSVGTTKKLDAAKVVETNNRIGFDESSVNTFQKFEGAWYLNAGLHPEVEMIEDLVANRQLPEFGIKDVRFVDPKTVLRYENKDIISIVEMKTEGKKGDNTWQIRIAKETRTNKTADLKSSNIAWVEEAGSLRPAFQYFKKNEENTINATCTCGTRHTIAISSGLDIDKMSICRSKECDGLRTLYARVDADGTVHVFIFDAEKDEISALADDKYMIPNYVPVVNYDCPKEVLVLALAFAQYAHGLDMAGLVDEE